MTARGASWCPLPTKWEVNRAVRGSDLPAPSRLIMLTLSDIAEAGTAEVPGRRTPSLDVLAKETGLGRSTVAEHLAGLRKDGWLEVTPNPGDRNGYRLLIPWAPDGNPVEIQEPDGVQEPDFTDVVEESRSRTDEVQEPDGSSPGAGLPIGKNDPDNLDDLLGAATPQPDPKAAKPKGKRGTRVPAGFAATAEMIEWAREHTPLVGAAETAAFVDYWTAQPGQRGVKLDWLATWRNWMRKAQEFAEIRQQRAQGRASPQAERPPAGYHKRWTPEED